MNNDLLLIFNCLVVFFSQWAIFYAFEKLTEKQIISNNTTVPIIIIIASLAEVLLANYLIPFYHGLISVIYFLIILKITSKKPFKEIIIYIILLYLIGILLDILAMVIFILILSIIPQINQYMLLVKPIGTLFLAIGLILTIKISFIKKSINKIVLYLKKLNYTYIYLFLIISIYFALGVLSIDNIESKNNILIIFTLATLLTLTIVSFILSRYEIITLKETNYYLIKNNEYYLKSLQDYHILKHNLTNQLIGVKSIANIKAQALLDDLITSYNATFKSSGDVHKVPSGINGIIYEKLYNFNQKEIEIAVDNKINNHILKVLKPRSYNLLCEALGTILDNALEAASKSDEKIIYLKFNETEDCIIVDIINTFVGYLNVDKFGSFSYTTKNKGHGLGIYSLLDKKKLNVQMSIKNNLFISTITIEKIKKDK